jgi:hypothetical protein
MRMQSNFSSLCKGTLIPKEIRNKETIHRFMEAVAQFERIVNDSGFVSLQRLTEDDIIGTDENRDYWNSTSRYRGPEHQCRTSHSELKKSVSATKG